MLWYGLYMGLVMHNVVNDVESEYGSCSKQNFVFIRGRNIEATSIKLVH